MGDAYPFPGTTQITTQQEWEGFFAAIGSGVITGLAPSLNSGARQAVISAGRAIVQGFLKPVESSTGTAIPAASPQNRVDRLVLRLDRDAVTAADLVKPVVLTGTPGSSTPPALTRSTTGKWDLPIARWTSQANGALTGLVDEREWLGNRVRRCTSTSRPTSPQAGDIIYETDTGRWMGWRGTAWATLGPVSSESAQVAATGSTQSGWETLATSTWVTRWGGAVLLRLGSFRRTGSAISSESRLPGLIPASFRHPNLTLRTAVMIGNVGIGHVTVYPANHERAGQMWMTLGSISTGVVLQGTDMHWVLPGVM